MRSFASDRPTKCFEWLNLAKYWFNTNYYTAIKVTPYEALYGFAPPRSLDYISGTTKVADVDIILQPRHSILSLLKQNLLVAQTKTKQ